MATTNEKFYSIGLEEVKTTDGQPAPEPDYEAASKLAREKKTSIAWFARLAGIFAGLDLSK